MSELWRRFHRTSDSPVAKLEEQQLSGCNPGANVALSNIGSPNIVSRVVYGDHHRYTARDVERIAAQMRRDGARAVLTTAKDAVKLASFPELRDKLFVAHLRVVIEQEEQLLAMVRQAITNRIQNQ